MAVYDACRRVGDQVAREVSPTIMTPDEVRQTQRLSHRGPEQPDRAHHRRPAVAVTPLTTAQQRAVDALVAAQRLERVAVDERRCVAFLEQAETALADLPPSGTRRTDTTSPTTPRATSAKPCWRRTAAGPRTDPVSTMLLADSSPRCSTPRRRTLRRGTTTRCGATAIVSVTTPDRSPSRRPRLRRMPPRFCSRGGVPAPIPPPDHRHRPLAVIRCPRPRPTPGPQRGTGW